MIVHQVKPAFSQSHYASTGHVTPMQEVCWLVSHQACCSVLEVQSKSEVKMFFIVCYPFEMFKVSKFGQR